MEESNLVSHARRELNLIGEDIETVYGYLGVIQAFADMGHSGGSAMVAIPVIERLLNFKPLMPLTNDPDEWIAVGERMWQSSRDPEAFSYDQGLTHYLLSERDVDPTSIHITDPKRVPVEPEDVIQVSESQTVQEPING